MGCVRPLGRFLPLRSVLAQGVLHFQGGLQGDQGHLQHTVVGLGGGDLLHHQPGPLQRPHQGRVLRTGQALEHFVGNSRHQGQQGQTAAQSAQHVARIASEEEEHHDGNQHHDHQKAGAAPGMQPAELAGVLHSELLARLKAEDGLVLGAVVLKHPADFLQLGAQVHVQQKHRHAHRAADEVQGQLVGDEQLAQRLNPRGQGEKQRHRQDDGQDHRAQDHHVVRLHVQRLGQLFLKGAGLLRLAARHLRRFGQRLHAVDQGQHEADHAPDDGPVEKGILLPRPHRLAGAVDDLAVALAHRDGGDPGALHHHALHHRLAAYGHAALGKASEKPILEFL